MHRNNAEYQKIECSECGWKTLLDFNGIFDWLVKYRILKRNSTLDDPLVYELFHSMSSRYKCPTCGGTKLRYSVEMDDFSDIDDRRCRGCGKVIPRERISRMPETVYCVPCAEKIERGEPLEIEAEYCPICGKMMDLVEFQDGKYKAYHWVCPSVPPCRFRKKRM